MEGGDFTTAGNASSQIKKMLKQLNVDPRVVKRVVIALYEAEVNIVAHAYRGVITAEILPSGVRLKLADEGPGIPDIEQAMTPGFSTASAQVREMGFGAGMGFSNVTKRNITENNRFIIEKVLKKTFSPEFLNRLDEQVLFNPLTKDDICKIIDIELNDLYKRIDIAGYSLTVSDEAKQFVAEQGYDPQFGARPLKRAIQRYIEDTLAEAIVGGKFKMGDKILIEMDKDGLKEGEKSEKLKVSRIEE